MASEFIHSDQLNASVDGGPVSVFTAPPYDPNGFNGGYWTVWVPQEFQFTAAGTTATVQFDSNGLNQSGYDVGFDNVQLRDLSTADAAPEPSTLGFMLLGMGMTTLGLRRRAAARK
jgi:hypothetical protein